MTPFVWLVGYSLLGAWSLSAGWLQRGWVLVVAVMGALALGVASPHEITITGSALLVSVVVSLMMFGAARKQLKPAHLLGPAFGVFAHFLLVAVAHRVIWLIALPMVIAVMRIGERMSLRGAMWLLAAPVLVTTAVLFAMLP